MRDLLDHDVVHEILEVLTVDGAELERAPVDHDAGRSAAPAGQKAGQGDTCGLDLVVDGPDSLEGRHVLDSEVDALQLLAPPLLDVLDRVEDQIVETLAGRDDQGHPPGGQRATRSTASAVSPTTRDAAHRQSVEARHGRGSGSRARGRVRSPP